MLGWATVRDAEPIIWTDYEEFHRPENEALHHITRGSAYDMKPGETKYGYYMDSPRREAPYTVTERGNVSRDVYKPIQKGQVVIPAKAENGTRESKADFGEKLKRKFTGTITADEGITLDRTEYGNLVHNIKTGRAHMSSSTNRGYVDSGSPMGLYRYFFKTADYRDVHVYEVSSVPEGIATERIYREEYDYANDITGDEFARRGSPATTYQGSVNPSVPGQFPIGNSDGVQIQGESRTNDGLSVEQSASDTRANHPSLGGVDQGDTVSAQVTDETTRHSYSDAEYIELAKDPEANREQLQAMVDGAAWRWGAKLDSDRNPQKFYHGTRADEFYVFDTSRAGENYGGYNASGGGVSFTYDKDDAMMWGYKASGFNKARVVPAYLKAEKTFYTYSDETDLTEFRDVLPNNMSSEEASRILSAGGEFKRWVEAQPNLDFKTVLLHHGYDSYGDYPGGNELAVYSPDQIKSADPVTYDAAGNVIPLSERFRTDRTGEDAWKNSDIRYAKVDSEGRIENPYAEGTPEYELLNRVTGSTPEDVELWLQSLMDRANGLTKEDISRLSASAPLSTGKGFAIPPKYTEEDRNAMTRRLEELRGNYGALKDGENAAREANFPQRVNDQTFVRRFRRTATV